MRVQNTEITVVKFGKHEKIKAVGDLQLAEDGSKMVPQGLFADTKLLRYFFVRGAGLRCEGPHDRPLFPREGVDFFRSGIRRRLCRANTVDKKASCSASTKPQFASVDLLDCFDDLMRRLFFVDYPSRSP